MTNPARKFIRKLNNRFSKKQDELKRVPAEIGDGIGNIDVPGMDGFIYVRINNKPVPVFNNRVPNQNGTAVWVGYSAEEPQLLQVLSTRSESPAGALSGYVGYAPARRYEWHAVHGGQDPLYVHIRAMTPLRLSVSDTVPTPSTPPQLLVNLYRGFVYNGERYYRIDRQDIDIGEHKPTTPGMAAFVLVTIDDSGSIVQTKGDEVDIDSLAITDLPAIPANTTFVCGAVRVYYGQEKVQEGRTNTDFVDLRFTSSFSFSSGGGGGGTWGSITGTLSDQTDLQAALDGKLPDTNTANRVLITDGSGDITTEAKFNYDSAHQALVLGAASAVVGGDNSIELIGDGEAAGEIISTFGSGVNPFVSFVRGGGTKDSPTKTISGMIMGILRARGYYDSGAGALTDSRGYIQFIAADDWDGTSTPVDIEAYVTPSGSVTPIKAFTLKNNGQVIFSKYGSGSLANDVAFALGVDSSGNVVESTDWRTVSTTPTRIANELDGTYTVTIASPAIATKTTHNLVLGQKIRLTTTGALPTGLATGTDYYVIPVTANTFEFASSLDNAKAGTAINTSGSQSGTHSLVCNFDPVYRLQFAGVDLSSKLQEGMPIRWTQNSIVRYGFICSTPNYSGGNTTFYVLTRCDSTSADYDVLDTGSYPITGLAHSLPKVFPVGFPQLSQYWILEMVSTSTKTASGSTAGTAYNPGGLSLLCPTGAWTLQAQHIVWIEYPGSSRLSVNGGVSSDPTVMTNINLGFYFLAYSTDAIANGGYLSSTNIHVSLPTTYYLMAKSNTSGITAVKIVGAADRPTILRVISSYV